MCGAQPFSSMFRACLGELHAAPDPKNQLHSKFSPPNTPNSSSSTVDLLHKKVEQTPNSMAFMECLKRYSTKSKFPEVG
jgi:hypothetical protein